MSPPSSSSARLDVTQGPLQGQSVDLNAPETVAGREPGCGLALTSYREVSRRHARFYLQNGTWCIEDLGSTNGTFVNSVRATPSFSLADGAQIQMGDFHARFRLLTPGTSPSPPQATQYSPVPPPPVPQQVTPIPVVPVSVMPVAVQPYQVIYPPQPPKQVALALLFAFLLIGGGQFYNGEVAKGAILLCVSLALGFIFLILGLLTFGLAFGLIWIVHPALWIFGIIDAVITAERINREWSGQRPY